MKKYVNLFVFVFMIGACLSQGRAQTKSAVSYKNPVVDIAMPDPTVIKAADGYFYVYATESTRNVLDCRSKCFPDFRLSVALQGCAAGRFPFLHPAKEKVHAENP